MSPSGSGLPLSCGTLQQADELRRRHPGGYAVMRSFCTAAVLAVAASMASAADLNCNDPQVAALVRDIFNDLLKERAPARGLQVTDMTHAETVHNPEAALACHGEFLFNNGGRATGTLTVRRNAGGMTPSFDLDSPQ